MGLVTIARGAVSPRPPVHGEVVAVSGPRTDEGASSVLGTVEASAYRPLGFGLNFAGLTSSTGL
jgi:hypothetical protein